MLSEQLNYLVGLVNRKDELQEIFEMSGRKEFVESWVEEDIHEHLIFAQMILHTIKDAEWVKEILGMAEKKAKTVEDMISISEFYVKELKDEEKAYVLYGMATAMSENSATDLCDTAFSILLTLHDRDTASTLYHVGVGAFEEIEDLEVLKLNIRRFHPDRELLEKVNEKIAEAEKKNLPKFSIAIKGYDKDEVVQFIKKWKIENKR